MVPKSSHKPILQDSRRGRFAKKPRNCCSLPLEGKAFSSTARLPSPLHTRLAIMCHELVIPGGLSWSRGHVYTTSGWQLMHPDCFTRISLFLYFSSNFFSPRTLIYPAFPFPPLHPRYFLQMLSTWGLYYYLARLPSPSPSPCPVLPLLPPPASQSRP